MRVDIADVERGFTELERRQLPQASAWALNDAAYSILKDMQDRMDVVFDRPTRFTKNALMVWRATKQDLVAEVGERPSVGPRHYLKVQEAGGARGKTGMENLIGGLLDGGQTMTAIVPTAAARVDSYGNWARGERNNVLAGLREAGKSKGQPDGARSRRASYFVPAKGGLSPGIWRRKGKDIEKVATFTRAAPSYDQTLGFLELAEEKFREEFPERFDRALAKAMATAR